MARPRVNGIDPKDRSQKTESLRSQRSKDELTLRQEVRRRRRAARRANKLNEQKPGSADQTSGHVEPPGPAKKDKTAVGIALRALGTHKLTDKEKAARKKRKAKLAAGQGGQHVKRTVRREERNG